MAKDETQSFASRLPDVRWGLLPILLVPVVISFWPRSGQLSIDTDSALQPEEAPDSVDYYLRGAKMSALDNNGKLLYQFRADEVLHFPDNSAHISQLEMDYLGNEGKWKITSPIGISPANANELQLSGGVLIKGRSNPRHPISTITMAEARLLPDSRQLDTDSSVQMDEIGRKVRAVGMTLDIDKDVVKLKNKVRVNHAP